MFAYFGFSPALCAQYPVQTAQTELTLILFYLLITNELVEKEVLDDI